jgi:excisionase family DNA binding protein
MVAGTSDSDSRHDGLLSTQDAARYLGLCQRSVQKLARSGELASIRLTKRSVRFAKQDLHEFVERHRTHGVVGLPP